MLRAISIPRSHTLLDFYGLREQPFGGSPDCRCAPFGQARRDVLASLYFGVLGNRNLLTLIAADGLGKTFLLHQLVAGLEHQARMVFLPSAPRGRCLLLRDAFQEFDAPSSSEDPAPTRDATCHLAAGEQAAGRRSVLIIDDAENLDASSLDEIERLSSPRAASNGSLQVVLAGSPSLADTLCDPGLAAFRRRMTPVPGLGPLSPADTAGYIDHRLRAAGYDAKTPLFTRDALRRVVAATEGVPGRIDALCRRALTLGFTRTVVPLSLVVVEVAIADQEADRSRLSPAAEAVGEQPALEPLPMAVGQGPMLVFPTRPRPALPPRGARSALQIAGRQPGEPVIETVSPVEDEPPTREERPATADMPVICPPPADSPQLSALVQSLLAAQKEHAPCTILFASVDEGVQTAQLCADVAKVLAAAGTSRVLVVDADRRLSALHEQFGVGSTAGLTEVLGGNLSAERATVTVGPRLSLLTAGLVAPSGASCLLPEQAAGLMGELKTRFDYVLVNGMPFKQGSDSEVFAKNAEGVLLVVAAHATERAVARQAKERLEAAGAHLLGAVLTGRRFPIPEAVYRRL